MKEYQNLKLTRDFCKVQLKKWEFVALQREV